MREIDPPDDDAPVVVAVVRTGGIAGRRRQWRVAPDPAEATDWIALIDRCPWDEPPADPRGADRFVWLIRARTPGVEHEREVADTEIEGAWKALIAAVQEAHAHDR